MIVVQRTSSPTITVNKQYLSEFIYCMMKPFTLTKDFKFPQCILASKFIMELLKITV
mgnify:CR=1 FL=1